MEANSETTQAAPPRLIPAVTAGFNLIAANVWIILLPLALDLWLWFGPKLRLKTLLLPWVTDFFSQLPPTAAPESAVLIQRITETWQKTLESFNLLGVLRTYPIGVPSLMSVNGVAQTPLGPSQEYEMITAAGALGLWLLLLLAGLFIGSLFFGRIARLAFPTQRQDTLRALFWQFMQILIFNLALIFLLMVLLFPIALATTLLAAINPDLAQIALFLMGLVLIWLLFPLVFAPHGVFALRQNVVSATLTSLRLVRFFLPGASLFLVVLFVISQGLDIIWRIPPSDSWMLLLGLGGHAFISSSLIAASFVYYRGGIEWMQANLKKIMQPSSPTRA